MDEIVRQLEMHIRALIQNYKNSEKINQHLMQGKQLMLCEKELLLTKQKSVVLLIENMVERLKSIEGLQ